MRAGHDGSMEQVRKVLAEKRKKLEADMTRMSAPPTETGGISFGKRVGEGTSMAVDRLQDVAAHDKAQAVYAEVRRAQQKVDEDTYGRCDNCGNAIGEGRLEALPWATLCIACAR